MSVQKLRRAELIVHNGSDCFVRVLIAKWPVVNGVQHRKGKSAPLTASGLAPALVESLASKGEMGKSDKVTLATCRLESKRKALAGTSACAKPLVEFPLWVNGRGAWPTLGLASVRAGCGRLSHAALASQKLGLPLYCISGASPSVL
jgi:hypothetical protein